MIKAKKVRFSLFQIGIRDEAEPLEISLAKGDFNASTAAESL